MFRRNRDNTPAYPNMPFFSMLGQPAAPQDTSGLINRYDEAMAKEQLESAVSLAEQIAVQVGVPGLIRHVDASILLIRRELEQGEIVQQSGFNSLVYLNLAEHLLERDKKSPGFIKKYLPNQAKSIKDDIGQRKSELIELASLRGLENEANITASQFYAKIANQNNSPRPAKK